MVTAEIGDTVKLDEKEAALLSHLDKELRKVMVKFWEKHQHNLDREYVNVNNSNATVLGTMLADLVAFTAATESHPVLKIKYAVMKLIDLEIDRRYKAYLQEMVT